ncbi:MAG: hypothetical protein ACOCP1_01860 [Campylobacterales bacterium]
MNKIFVLIALVVSCFALPKDYWKSSYVVELEKDQILEIEFVPKDGVKKKLTYRWTLYKNRGLVVILRYDGFVRQFVLNNEYQRDSFKEHLYPENKYYQRPFFLLKFVDFDRKTNKAKLQNFVHIGEMKMDIGYKKQED